MNKNDNVLISLVTYNSESWLAEFFESLLDQTFPCKKLDLVIRDNGSRDRSLETLHHWQARTSDRFSRFDVFEDKNIGFGTAHNKNIIERENMLALIINPDVRLTKRAISIIVGIAKRDAGKSVAAWEMRQAPYEHPKYYCPATGECDWVCAAGLLVDCSVFRAVGGFDEKIFLYCEDVDLSFRLRHRGYKLKYCPESLIYHFPRLSSGGFKKSQFCGELSGNLLLRLRYGSYINIAMVPVYMTYILLKYGFDIARFGLVLRAYAVVMMKGIFFLRSRSRYRGVGRFSRFNYGLSRVGGAFRLREDVVCARVSIVIRTCNQRIGWLDLSLRSACQQTYGNVEILVIEDGSDYSRGAIERCRAEFNSVLIRYFPIEKAGRSAAANVGMSNASGRYICFLDDDDLLFADHIDTLLLSLSSAKSFRAAYAPALCVETDVRSLAPLRYEEKRFFHSGNIPYAKPLLWHKNYIPIQCVLFERDLFKECGGMSAEMPAFEDWDLWLRFSQKTDFLYVPKTTSIYRVPYNSDKKYVRQMVLDSELSTIEARKKELLRDVSVEERRLFECQIDAYGKLFGIKLALVKYVILKFRILRPLYSVMSRLALRVQMMKVPD